MEVYLLLVREQAFLGITLCPSQPRNTSIWLHCGFLSVTEPRHVKNIYCKGDCPSRPIYTKSWDPSMLESFLQCFL